MFPSSLPLRPSHFKRKLFFSTSCLFTSTKICSSFVCSFFPCSHSFVLYNNSSFSLLLPTCHSPSVFYKLQNSVCLSFPHETLSPHFAGLIHPATASAVGADIALRLAEAFARISPSSVFLRADINPLLKFTCSSLLPIEEPAEFPAVIFVRSALARPPAIAFSRDIPAVSAAATNMVLFSTSIFSRAGSISSAAAKSLLFASPAISCTAVAAHLLSAGRDLLLDGWPPAATFHPTASVALMPATANLPAAALNVFSRHRFISSTAGKAAADPNAAAVASNTAAVAADHSTALAAIAIVGAGQMGTGIAITAAYHLLRSHITLLDITEEQLQKARVMAASFFENEKKKGRLTNLEAEECMRRLSFIKLDPAVVVAANTARATHYTRAAAGADTVGPEFPAAPAATFTAHAPINPNTAAATIETNAAAAPEYRKTAATDAAIEPESERPTTNITPGMYSAGAAVSHKRSKFRKTQAARLNPSKPVRCTSSASAVAPPAALSHAKAVSASLSFADEAAAAHCPAAVVALNPSSAISAAFSPAACADDSLSEASFHRLQNERLKHEIGATAMSQKLYKNLQNEVVSTKHSITLPEQQQQQQRLEQDAAVLLDAPEALRNATFCIEAVTENKAAKESLFRFLDIVTAPTAILASNTSSISITQLAGSTRRPQQVIGMHFMNPVPRMQLVEVILGMHTSPQTLDITRTLALRLRKVAALAKDRPGFVANRLLMPYINEAVFVLEEHVATAEDIDKIMKLGTHMPMGPLELADFIGLDTCLSIMNVLRTEFQDSKYRPAPLLVQYVRAGLLGRKTGQGFYDYIEKPDRRV